MRFALPPTKSTNRLSDIIVSVSRQPNKNETADTLFGPTAQIVGIMLDTSVAEESGLHDEKIFADLGESFGLLSDRISYVLIMNAPANLL